MKLDTTLYLVTDSTNLEEDAFLLKVEEALRGGVTLLQLREKERSGREYLRLARSVREVADRYGVPLLIDDRVDVALACGSAGVHGTPGSCWGRTGWWAPRPKPCPRPGRPGSRARIT